MIKKAKGIKMFTKQFWIEASERALKTLAQTFVAVTAGVSVFNAFDADWASILGASVGAALLSYATSIISAKLGPKKDSPSLVE